MRGLVHIYTGNGKGKTTAAIGLGIRAYGRGMKVLMVQFLKGQQTGEMKTLEKLAPGFELHRSKEIRKFTWNMTQDELDNMKTEMTDLYEYAVKEAMSGMKDMVILDEIMASVASGFIAVEDVLELVQNKPDRLELVMTGRNAPAELILAADYVSEISPVKHPLQKGIAARKGIEF